LVGSDTRLARHRWPTEATTTDSCVDLFRASTRPIVVITVFLRMNSSKSDGRYLWWK